MNRTYSELLGIARFEDRFEYLRITGRVGAETFGSERYLNQRFYNSYDWKQIRDFVIVRDNGCDLAFPGREIFTTMYVHHINPLTPNDVKNHTSALFDPENLITVTHETHNAIHYGNINNLVQDFVERRPGDTKAW